MLNTIGKNEYFIDMQNFNKLRLAIVRYAIN